MIISTCRCALIIFLLAAGQCLALARTVSGEVKDINNQPLSGVRITLIAGGEKQVFESGTGGRFSISLPDQPGDVYLLFESPQFTPETKTLAPGTGDVVLDVYLIPLKLLKEDVTVTALNEEEKSVDIPFAQNVVSSFEIRENQPENVVNALINTPGVSFIGRGGFTVTPSIRGLARRRVLVMVDGARLTSDRSAGTSASFVPPQLIRDIEVLRSSASVIYGSDAIGGVINILTRDGRQAESGLGTVYLGGASNDTRINTGLALHHQFGRYLVYSNVQMNRADDYSSAEGRVYNSGYKYFTGDVAVSRLDPERDLTLRFIKSYGQDIERPDREYNPDKRALYPLEDNNLLSFNYDERGLVDNGVISVEMFFNPNRYDLQKYKFSTATMDASRSRASDMGFRGALKKTLRADLSYQVGIDYFGRHNVDMENYTLVGGVLDARSLPLQDGTRSDYGVFFTLDYSGFDALDLLGGVRYGYFSRSGLSDGIYREKTASAPAAFVGVTRKLGDSVNVFFNLGTAFRMPSLSESFYTGITGRSQVVGNPNLDPERSLNLDGGIKFFRNNVFLGAYVFQYGIRDLIEKYLLPDEIYTYANVDKGRIRGVEMEFQYYPVKNLEFFGNWFYYHGTSTVTGQPLNDVPTPKVVLGGKIWLNRFWAEVEWLYSVKGDAPGPAEIAVDDFTTTDVKAGYYLSNRLFLFLKMSNLFDRFYYANMDPDIPPARGFDLSLGLNLNF